MPDIVDWTEEDVAKALQAGEITLIDVREPNEYGAQRIPGALLYPLSTFDPLALPVHESRKIVFHCAAGIRSARAIAACEGVGISAFDHMPGGIKGWHEAGLPLIWADPATGQLMRSS
ncbi:rhodanese-like domain-containing protein [Woodsholea maritima]|uniref:rhodanese-like domain-containing protein n=1 Tax=Woodsholea maritima TaxID=240237 RepID=UPI00036A42EC|nr:rhodanese-like domain-containing protein [Woodsholea maritima]